MKKIIAIITFIFICSINLVYAGLPRPATNKSDASTPGDKMEIAEVKMPIMASGNGKKSATCATNTGYFGICRRVKLNLPGSDLGITDDPSAVCEEVMDPNQECTFWMIGWRNIVFFDPTKK